MVRLRKPLSYYKEKYGTWMYGLSKLYLMMEKQHNRGQEGAGLAAVKLHAKAGEEYMFRERAQGQTAISEIFGAVHRQIAQGCHDEPSLGDFGGGDEAEPWAAMPFAGEIYMGHLRYSTTGRSGLAYVHPFLRRNNWRARNLLLCANFNMTNVPEIFEHIATKGQHPRMVSDTYLLLEQLGHRLDRESERLYQEALGLGLTDLDITRYIEDHIDLGRVLRLSAPVWDGGYVLCGATGSGEMMTLRDPWGIRPAFWYQDEELVVVASERPVIQTSLDVPIEQVHELQPGQALLVDKEGRLRLEQILPAAKPAACSFERVYFSRGSDRDIYRERKALGRSLVGPILQAIHGEVDNTVFSYIPNTAEAAYYGILEGFDEWLGEQKIKQIASLMADRQGGRPGKENTPKELEDALRHILSRRIRAEKVAWKDIKMRTFIADGAARGDLAAHVYDITYGSLRAGEDNLVIIDDSIVRGTTLRQSILRILDRLHPRRIVIVSSAPQVRYPDYYGIDMAHMEEFIAFRAAISLIKQRGMLSMLADIYRRCKAQTTLPKEQVVNYVREVYAPFTTEEINEEMVRLLRPEGVQTEIRLVYQSLEGLHEACPLSPGDWYFSGYYPTPGGNKRVNQAFVDFYQSEMADFGN